MKNLNYVKILQKILNIAINDRFINFAGQGDIYEINAMNINDYPIFWVAVTEQITEHSNYINYPLTLYYIDREKFMNDDEGDTDQPLIHSNGIMILSNIIKKIKAEFDNEMLNEITEVNYTVWGDTEIFSDKCSGVYCNINLAFPVNSLCPVD